MNVIGYKIQYNQVMQSIISIRQLYEVRVSMKYFDAITNDIDIYHLQYYLESDDDFVLRLIKVRYLLSDDTKMWYRVIQAPNAGPTTGYIVGYYDNIPPRRKMVLFRRKCYSQYTWYNRYVNEIVLDLVLMWNRQRLQ